MDDCQRGDNINRMKVYRFESCPDYKKLKVMKDYYIDNKEYYLWCIENDMIPYY